MTATACKPKEGTKPGSLHLLQEGIFHPIVAVWKGGEHAEWITSSYGKGMTLRRGAAVAADGYRYIAPVPDPADTDNGKAAL